jgi:hypothetical protein
MAWSTPLTAVSNATLTAAQWNASVRDNLLETAPAKATAAGRLFVSTGANAIAERVPTVARVETSQSTSSASFVDLATVGPAVTVTTGTRALVFISAGMTNSVATGAAAMGYAVSGASTIAATNATDLRADSPGTSEVDRATSVSMLTSLTAGSNVFTAKYRVGSGGTATFDAREIMVIPL